MMQRTYSWNRRHFARLAASVSQVDQHVVDVRARCITRNMFYRPRATAQCNSPQ